MKKSWLRYCFFLIVLHLSVIGYAHENTSFEHSYNLHIKNIVLDHRFDLHKVELDLSFNDSFVGDYAIEGLNLEHMREIVLTFIQNYEDKAAYWEILNQDLILHLIKEFPNLDEITSQLRVFASPTKPHDRCSTVYYDKVRGMTEHFSFELELEDLSPIKDEKSYLIISFDYMKNISKDSYANFFDIKGDMVKLFKKYYSKYNPLTFLHVSTEELLKKYSAITSFKIQLKHLLFKEEEREDHCEWTMIIHNGT